MLTLKKLLLLAVLVCSAQYSYSESIAPYYGQTGNAAVGGNRWVMDNILPSVPGLDINGVIYNYTIQKQLEDSVTVNVQNENATGTGYIFRSIDEWQPGSLGGTQINRVIPVAPSNRILWGDGSIEVTGDGSVIEPRVVYNYRVEPCYDPQFDPNCPGYQVPVPEIPEVDYNLYDPLLLMGSEQAEWDSNNELYNDEEEMLSEEELAEQEALRKQKTKERLEKALAISDSSAMFAQAFNQAKILQQMNNVANMTPYYAASINGGVYNETVTLDGGNISDNRKALSNMAQDKLHKNMVDMQY